MAGYKGLKTAWILSFGLVASAMAAQPISQTSVHNNQPVSAEAPAQPAKHLWNLQNADIRAVIHTMAQLTGKNFIIDPRVEGHITIVSKTPMTVAGLYKVFLSMLSVLDYAAIENGNVIKIVPATDAKQFAGGKEKKSAAGSSVVMRVVPVNNISAMQLVPILRPFMQEWGSVTAYNPSNTLLIAGSRDNVKRLVAIVRQMDHNDASEIKLVPLTYSNAKSLVSVLTAIQAGDRSEGKVTNVTFAADTDSNGVLVSGNAANIKQMVALIHRLDTKSSRDSGNVAVVHLRYLSAKSLAPILTRIAHGQVATEEKAAKAGGGTVSTATSALSSMSAGDSSVAVEAIPNGNSIVISAPAVMIQRLKRVIASLDVKPRQVLVEAIIVRVNESLVNKLGIMWGSATNNSADDTAGTLAGFKQGVGFLRDVTIKGLLQALTRKSGTDVLATPSVVVLNNQKASISDGKNIGLQNRSYATTDTGGSSSSSADSSNVPFTTLERTDVTLKLDVTPQISPDRTVLMKIDQSDKQVDPTGGTSDNPVLDTSEIKTSVMVKSGDILVLGGLIRHDNKSTKDSVPILGSIPILGKLFQYDDNDNEKQNLMVFMKPIILRDASVNERETLQRYRYIRQQEVIKAAGEPLVSKSDFPVLPGAHASGARRAHLPLPFSHD